MGRTYSEQIQTGTEKILDCVMTKDMQANPGSASTGAMPEIPPHIVQSARSLAQRGMGRAVLLFLTGHAPLAFLAGTLLHGVAPLLGVLASGLTGNGAESSRQLHAWGDLLGEPQALAALRPHLLAHALPDTARGTEPAVPDCGAPSKEAA